MAPYSGPKNEDASEWEKPVAKLSGCVLFVRPSAGMQDLHGVLMRQQGHASSQERAQVASRSCPFSVDASGQACDLSTP
jgi:hypothetical protein